MIHGKPPRAHGQSLAAERKHQREERSYSVDAAKRQDYLGAIFSDTSISCLTRIAENISMPASMLEQLALHNDASVREAVADNPNTPLDTMWLLARDESVDVRYAIAENHNVALAILTFLSEDENPYVACRARATMDRLWGCSVLDRGYWRRSERAVG